MPIHGIYDDKVGNARCDAYLHTYHDDPDRAVITQRARVSGRKHAFQYRTTNAMTHE